MAFSLSHFIFLGYSLLAQGQYGHLRSSFSAWSSQALCKTDRRCTKLDIPLSGSELRCCDGFKLKSILRGYADIFSYPLSEGSMVQWKRALYLEPKRSRSKSSSIIYYQYDIGQVNHFSKLGFSLCRMWINHSSLAAWLLRIRDDVKCLPHSRCSAYGSFLGRSGWGHVQ